jgi:hypothetical protein
LVDQYTFEEKDGRTALCDNGISHAIYEQNGDIKFTLPLHEYPKVNQIHPEIYASKALYTGNRDPIGNDTVYPPLQPLFRGTPLKGTGDDVIEDRKKEMFTHPSHMTDLPIKYGNRSGFFKGNESFNNDGTMTPYIDEAHIQSTKIKDAANRKFYYNINNFDIESRDRIRADLILKERKNLQNLQNSHNGYNKEYFSNNVDMNSRYSGVNNIPSRVTFPEYTFSKKMMLPGQMYVSQRPVSQEFFTQDLSNAQHAYSNDLDYNHHHDQGHYYKHHGHAHHGHGSFPHGVAPPHLDRCNSHDLSHGHSYHRQYVDRNEEAIRNRVRCKRCLHRHYVSENCPCNCGICFKKCRCNKDPHTHRDPSYFCPVRAVKRYAQVTVNSHDPYSHPPSFIPDY